MSKIKKKLLGFILIISVIFSIGFQSDFFEVAKQIDIYTTLFKELNMYYIDEINPAKLTNKAIKSMLESLDPYTRYYDEQGVEDAQILSSGEYGGIGAVSKFNDKTLTIRKIIKNSPAEKQGIKPGDKILKINDVFVKDFDEKGVSALLNGLPNSKVKLQLERQNEVLNLELIRKKIILNPVPFYTKLENNIGYISFTIFNEKASQEVKKAFLELKDLGIEKLIIDIRGNPGGLLNEAVKISNFFIPKNKVVVTTKAKVEKWSETFKTRNEPIDKSIPIIVLVDKHSASASEILAGSLQDYDRAVIVGERSFGKGLVQRYRKLSYGTQMKLTIAKYYIPSGRCIQELDYTNRTKEGTIPKFSDAGREAFKTEKGRIVYGGGGILPDVEIDKVQTNKTTQVLLKSDAFFNYGIQYMYTHNTIEKPSKFNLNETDYFKLRAYLSAHQNDFEMDSEKKLKNVEAQAETEDLKDGMQDEILKLSNAIGSKKLKELDKNKDEILDKLTSEIVQNYYYDEGVFQQKVHFDKTISKAALILNNQKNYLKILN